MNFINNLLGKTTEERKKNLVNAFKVTKDVKGKRILVIDDVITTGATVAECSKILKENGAKLVFALSIAD